MRTGSDKILQETNKQISNAEWGEGVSSILDIVTGRGLVGGCAGVRLLLSTRCTQCTHYSVFNAKTHTHEYKFENHFRCLFSCGVR